MRLVLPSPAYAIATSCDAVPERAHAWLDDELAPDEALVLRAHLARCGPCARALEADVAQRRAIRARALLDVAPAALRRRVRALLAGA